MSEHLRGQGFDLGPTLWRSPMDTNTLLIIVLIVLLLGGGGFYGRGRWW
jgi:hypothetical protein